VLGLLGSDAEIFLKNAVVTGEQAGLDDAAVEALLAERNQARADRDWANSDRIRDQLAEAGVILEDGPGGTRWRRG